MVLFAASCNKDPETTIGKLDLISCFVGNVQLQYGAEISEVPLNQDVIIKFSVAVDTNSARQNIRVTDENSVTFGVQFVFADDGKIFLLKI